MIAPPTGWKIQESCIQAGNSPHDREIKEWAWSVSMNQNRLASSDMVRLLDEGSPASLSEWQLLEHYLAHRDELAFETLVSRFGPMVLGTCRRMLGDTAEVDDAFQATFLVFVRRARSLGPGIAVGAWLHGVAVRVSQQARSSAARRRCWERLEAVEESAAPAVENSLADAEMRDSSTRKSIGSPGSTGPRWCSATSRARLTKGRPGSWNGRWARSRGGSPRPCVTRSPTDQARTGLWLGPGGPDGRPSCPGCSSPFPDRDHGPGGDPPGYRQADHSRRLLTRRQARSRSAFYHGLPETQAGRPVRRRFGPGPHRCRRAGEAAGRGQQTATVPACAELPNRPPPTRMSNLSGSRLPSRRPAPSRRRFSSAAS